MTRGDKAFIVFFAGFMVFCFQMTHVLDSLTGY